jgi:NAD(P)-dependent dehydrogenase (short-subunit alcohol dehydrogenase family)
VQAAVDQYGSLDVVVNNAGYAISAAIEEMTDDSRTALTGLHGLLDCTSAPGCSSSPFPRRSS